MRAALALLLLLLLLLLLVTMHILLLTVVCARGLRWQGGSCGVAQQQRQKEQQLMAA